MQIRKSPFEEVEHEVANLDVQRIKKTESHSGSPLPEEDPQSTFRYYFE